MQYRSLGRTGVQVSSLCLGAMNFGGSTPEAEAHQILNNALDAGINFIDTANNYNQGESERVLGRWFQSSGRRDKVVLATKVFRPVGYSPNDQGGSRYHILNACEDSLRRLQTDHIDLYQLHRPDFIIPQDETLRAFDDLVTSGKVRYIGCSTFPAWYLMEALSISERFNLVRFISEQPPYNLLDRRIENELIPLCQKYGLAVIPWSPIAGGILAGRYQNQTGYPDGSRAARSGSFRTRVTPRANQVVLRLSEMAQERSLTITQLALLWVKDQPGITAPITGPRTLAHLQDALKIADQTLDEADRPLFDALVHPGNVVSDFHDSSLWMKARYYDQEKNS
jgi:aryl-alcohol dehydrogenase-like predicted oxidoreductase